MEPDASPRATGKGEASWYPGGFEARLGEPAAIRSPQLKRAQGAAPPPGWPHLTAASRVSMAQLGSRKLRGPLRCKTRPHVCVKVLAVLNKQAPGTRQRSKDKLVQSYRHPWGKEVKAAHFYPVDILEDNPEMVQESTLAYYSTFGEQAGTSPPQYYSLPTGEKVKLEDASVCLLPLYRDEPKHKILVLVNPQDKKTVLAVYLNKSWWSTEEIMKTSDPSREGLIQVQSFGERIILFILNYVIFGRLERNLDDDMFFLPHSAKEHAKILWRNGAAIAFYTIKMKGSLCGRNTSKCYMLPVLDTAFVRRKHRREGLGMKMLHDFCQTFETEDALGISCPISTAMYQVCQKFLLTYPEEQDRLWEVEAPGDWGQRVNIWLKIQLEPSLSYRKVTRQESSEEAESSHRENFQDDELRPSDNGEMNKDSHSREAIEEVKENKDSLTIEDEFAPQLPRQESLNQEIHDGQWNAKRSSDKADIVENKPAKQVRPSF
ncbi:protein FAM169B-like [Gracilinanus agilis]|uniref:protein FAM169B-like n=1 Tax=Gracilinanus agilis TaxID=191870 RepID=UPI001CFF359C|nr:protein FAM169B-like [Gracilinanus agilis]